MGPDGAGWCHAAARRRAHRLRRRPLGHHRRPTAARLHRDPERVARLRPGLGRARPHADCGHPPRGVGPGAGDRGPHRRGGDPARPYPADRDGGAGPWRSRGAGRCRRGTRHRAALRPPRQAAADGRLA